MSIMWTNKVSPFIHGETIEEWDIKMANISLLVWKKLIKPDKAAKLAKLDKHDREVYVGKLMQKDPKIRDGLEQAFTEIVELFLKANKLDRETDVVSIKKDAIFVRNRTIKHPEFDNVKFRVKGNYKGFLCIPGYEFYYVPGKYPDVKGISDSALHKHKDGVLEFINSVFEEAHDQKELELFMKEYSEAYKEKKLPFDAYREFTSQSTFRVVMFGNEIDMDDIDEDLLDNLDISYNYTKIYLEVLKLVIGK